MRRNVTGDAMITGGPIERFRRGWAMFPFRGDRAHYWQEIRPDKFSVWAGAISDGGRVREYRSSCGMTAVADRKRPAMDPGNWPRCRRCQSIARKGADDDSRP